jgi:hypothetical protein
MNIRLMHGSFLAASFALLTLNVGTGFAASAPPENFAQRKSETLQRIDQRINHLQTQKSCVQAASNPDSLKNCREKSKSGDRQRRQRS